VDKRRTVIHLAYLHDFSKILSWLMDKRRTVIHLISLMRQFLGYSLPLLIFSRAANFSADTFPFCWSYRELYHFASCFFFLGGLRPFLRTVYNGLHYARICQICVLGHSLLPQFPFPTRLIIGSGLHLVVMASSRSVSVENYGRLSLRYEPIQRTH
jgi:hypothetical protein